MGSIREGFKYVAQNCPFLVELGSVILLGQSDAVHGILATREAHPDLVVHSFYWDPTCVGMIDYPYR